MRLLARLLLSFVLVGVASLDAWTCREQVVHEPGERVIAEHGEDCDWLIAPELSTRTCCPQPMARALDGLGAGRAAGEARARPVRGARLEDRHDAGHRAARPAWTGIVELKL